MKSRKNIGRLLTLTTGVIGAIAAVAVTAGSADAVSGTVDAIQHTSNGGGAHASAYVFWDTAHGVEWRDVYVNDFCNAAGHGDGVTARIEFMVRYVGKGWTKVGSRVDTGGCTSAPYRAPGPVYWNHTDLAINDAGIRACAGTACSAIDYRDNPFT